MTRERRAERVSEKMNETRKDKLKKLKHKMKFKRSLCTEADGLVNSERPDRYGFVGESMDKAARLATLLCTTKQLEGGIITPQMICIVLRALKQIRDTYTPENVDHLRDSIGYTELQDQLRQLGMN
jgi:hypothetical protein